MKTIVALLIFTWIAFSVLSPTYDNAPPLSTEDVQYAFPGSYNSGTAHICLVSGFDYQLVIEDDTMFFRSYDDGYLYSSSLGSGLAYFNSSDSTFNVKLGDLYLSRK